jgi:formylglycine-generating enzyme required for sulfatase activity
MDLETHPESLAKARAASQPAEAGARHHEDPAPEPTGTDAEDRSPLANPPATDTAGTFDSEVEPVVAEGGTEILVAGMVIGPARRQFRLVSELGSRGRIWLARAVAPVPNAAESGLEEFRAIKIFLPSTGPREADREERALRVDMINLRSYLTRVRARVDLALKLNHPHIARAQGWWHGADGWPFVEMEYLDHQRGRDLAQLLAEQGRNGFPFETMLEWLRPVAAALDYARREHRLAHQHLDVDTVFISGQGEIKLLGFGLATEPREPRSVLFSTGNLTEASGLVESVAVETTFRRDVFALALLVYRLLVGRSAYEAQNGQANMVPRPAGLTDDAWRVLRRGLAYPSELCPTDAGRFMRELEAAQQPAMGGAREPTAGWKRWGLAGGLGLAVVLGAYLLVGRHPGGAEPIQPAATDRAVAPVPASAPGASLTVSAGDAEREIDQRAFESAKRVNTLLAYRLYLQRCPRCGYEKETRAAIARIETQEKIDQIKTDFEKLAQALERDKRGDRGDEALSRLEALAALAPDNSLVAEGRRRLALGWAALAQASINQRDLAEARKWLKKAEAVQPKQIELARLTQALEQAETEDQARRLDAEAFAVAQRANTRRAYWTYLERCAPTTCSHRAEADAALARLAPPYPVLRDRLSDGSPGPEMVKIPAGGFSMGSPAYEKGRYNDEAPRPVRIEKPFAIGKYEVTFQEYDRFLAAAAGWARPSDQGWGRDRRPVINVPWKGAVAYADWLSKQTGARYRLPTEAEWEYAARAGVTASRYWGDDPDQGCAYANAADLDGKQLFVGWTAMKCHDGQVHTAPVGSYRSNDFGLHDMLGNVLEWTCSRYDKDTPSPVQDCEEPVGDRQFVVRGGSWNDEPRNVRSADRHRARPDFQDYALGFRLVRELP